MHAIAGPTLNLDFRLAYVELVELTPTPGDDWHDPAGSVEDPLAATALDEAVRQTRSAQQ
jgi:hypothetical protein